MKKFYTNLFELWDNYLLPCFLVTIGIYFFHGNLFKDGMNYIHGDLGDSRLISLLLEHSYRYLFGLNSTTSFWSPPWIYYPAKNGLAYSDVMAAGVFAYAPWRLMGIQEMTAYQLWFLSTSLANFGALLLLARYLGYSGLGSAIGAYIASFSMTNIAYANHPQMLSHYYLLLAAYFFLRVFDCGRPRDRIKFSACSALMYALQFWLAFYPLWFFTLIGSISGFFLLIAHRHRFRAICRDYMGAALTFVAVAAILIYPILRRYIIIKNLMGPRSWGEVNAYLPTWHAYLLPTAESLIYKSALFDKFHLFFTFHSELCMFSGFAVLGSPILFLICRRLDQRSTKRYILISSFAFSMLLTVLLSLKFSTDTESISLWKSVFKNIPGASAIRAVGRISLWLQILAALLIGYSVTIIQERFRWGYWVGFALLILVIFENSVEHNYLFSKQDHQNRLRDLAEQLPEDREICTVFHRSYRHDSFPFREIDAMLLSQKIGIPTSNGYSGGMPPDYWNADVWRSQSVDKISDWFNMNNYPIDQSKICFLP